MSAAETLVRELMLVSVLVAGEGADALADQLAAAGAAAEILRDGTAVPGFDLAILLAAPGDAAAPDTRALVGTLAGASDRLLLVPLPLGAVAGAAPALPELPQWFELFAELGYQPVVEFDAGFVSAGAFLVDRAATAAESDLAAFTDRLQTGAEAANQRETVAAAERSVRADLLAVRTELAAREAELAAARDGLAAAMQAAEAASMGWDALRSWVRLEAANPARGTMAALLADLPRLNALRAPDLPPIMPPPRLSLLVRLTRRPRAMPHPVLADAALVRASVEFDAAWYVACHPADFSDARLDPVLHYVLVGGPRGADPGPFFDSQAYAAAHPDAPRPVLVHALSRKAVLF